jgi:hypothetical protein
MTYDCQNWTSTLNTASRHFYWQSISMVDNLFTCSSILFCQKNFQSYPRLNMKVFEWPQLYKICQYMQSFINCPCVYNHIYSMSNLSCSMVYLNIDNRMYDTLGPLFLLIESKSSFLNLTLVFKYLEWFGAYSVIVAIWYAANHNHDCYILLPWKEASCLFARTLFQIHCCQLETRPAWCPHLPNFAFSFIQISIHPSGSNGSG